MMVRAAVLKGKDPTQIIVEMEKMDQMGERLHRILGSNAYDQSRSNWLNDSNLNSKI